jgi:osmotically-inducible protein OsmY
MTRAINDYTDLSLRDAVQRQLDWDARVDPSGIGVTAHAGVVTLTGYVDSYVGKLAAERAARRVRGVRGVANDVEVRLRFERVDPDLAADAVRALDLRATVPESVQVIVHNGYVTLTGTAPTLFHSAEAEKAVRYIRGVRGIRNRIRVIPQASAARTSQDIADALTRAAGVHGGGIEVRVADGVVTLTGSVATWNDRESAERAVMHAPGIAVVDNRLVVLAREPEVEEIC